jgi:hypothetical protein
MSRDGVRNQQTRLRIAQLAARLMLEHGIKDHAMAKRKAARQLGVTSANLLPGNDEVDVELRAYVALFEPESHERDIEAMRRQALEAMIMLARFQPVLIGGVAQGTASRHSDIELEVHADSSKEFEQYLLNQNIAFRTEERRGGPYYTLFSEPVDVMVHIAPTQAMQSAPRAGSEMRRRYTAAQLQELLMPAQGEGASATGASPGHEADQLAGARG